MHQAPAPIGGEIDLIGAVIRRAVADLADQDQNIRWSARAFLDSAGLSDAIIGRIQEALAPIPATPPAPAKRAYRKRNQTYA